MTGDFSDEPTFKSFALSFEEPLNNIALMARGNHDTEDV